jgi:phage terminase large subunit
MQIVNLNENLNPAHKHIFRSRDRRLLFYGSKGSGKSYTITDKILTQPTIQSHLAKRDIKLKYIIIRQSLPSLKRTCMELFEERSELFKIPYKLNKTDNVAIYSNGSKLVFIGLDHKDAYLKLQSITNVDGIWIEELPEVKEAVYQNADLTIRGGKGLYKQMIGTFNPVSTSSWVYKRWWEQNKEPNRKEFAFVEDNPYADKENIEVLKNLKNTNYSLYKVYYLGEWGRLEGVIYDNYEIVDEIPDNYDDIIYGLDFGFNNPTAMVKIYLYDWGAAVEQILYESKWTPSRLISFLKNKQIDNSIPIYCDSQNPEIIQEICDNGFNALPSNKSVEEGIMFCKGQKLKYLSTSYDLIREAEAYCWAKDKDGGNTDKPVKFNDHLMDAKRYALFTHLRKFQDVNIRII